MLKRRKFWKRVILFLIILPVILFSITIAIVYANQDKIVQHFLTTANEDFDGQINIKESHIAPFANFPYISIDLQGLSVFEDKDTTKNPVIKLEDIYLGFNLWTLIGGDFNIKAIKLANGAVNIVEYGTDDFNITRAFAVQEEKEIEDVEDEFNLDLQKIELDHVDINKINKDSLLFDADIRSAEIKFKSVKEHLYFSLISDFEMSMVDKGDTSFIKRKHITTDASLDYLIDKGRMLIEPSQVTIAEAQLNYQGSIDVENDFNVDLNFTGQKPDFSLIIGLIPDELIPVFKTFENRGDVFFSANVKGPTLHGLMPQIDVEFGCKDGFFRNPKTEKVLDELSFVASYTNGAQRNMKTSKFEIKDFNAKPEQGVFKVNLAVEDFESPDVDLNLVSRFDLYYLAEFLNLNQLTNLSGLVELETNFHDIIDLENPEKAIEDLNQSYYTVLKVEQLSFGIPGYKQKIENINVDLEVNGEKADLRRFDLKVGGSDLSITGNVNDLPSILHHNNNKIVSNLSLSSKAVDINELTLAKGDNSVDEYVRNFEMDLMFESSARALTESPYLPVGKFNISKLNADLTNYPHSFHDFKIDVVIDTADLRVIDLSGMIDKSDFHFNGFLKDYAFWFQDEIVGDAYLEFDLTSDLFQFKDIFTYDGENYIPEDYRDEELSSFKLHGETDIHFLKEGLHSADVSLTELTAKMKVHPLKFDNFNGRVHLEGDHISMEKFGGRLGNSAFDLDLEYYFGLDAAKQVKKNTLAFRAQRLDFDQLFNYELPETDEKVEHDSVFSVFDIPFPNMEYSARIKKMNYHKYLISNIKADLRTTNDHMLYIDTMQMDMAGGHIDLSGYFNGSDRNQIYFSPNMSVYNLDLDQLMFKFDNFGQDEVVSDNLHGDITGRIWGKIKMHADLIPNISDSDIHMDINITGGSIENYGPLEALSGYFEDEQLHKVIFDTLQNRIDMKDGEMVIPEMLINTNLGFIKVSGKQDMDMNMEYYLRVPLQMITGAGARKLFNKKKEKLDPEALAFDPDKKYRFVNIKIVGDAEDFKVTLGKNKNE